MESNTALGVTKMKSSLFDSRNKKSLAIFIVIFAIIGAYIISRSFAATGVVMTGAEGEYTAVTPARVLDTRNGTGGLQPLAANTEQALKLTANAGLPATNVSSVVVNLSAVSPQADGFITIWPSDQPKPATSSINYKAGKSITNQVTVKVGADGKIKMLSNVGNLNVVIDVFGSYATANGAKGARMNFTAPTRILDTRNGTGGVSTALTNGQTVGVQVAGLGGVPADAKAVTMTLTAVAPNANGFMTAYPSGVAKPGVASLNYTTNVNIANQVTIPIGSDGKIALYNQGATTNVVLDLTGYYKTPATGAETSQQGRYYAVNPERVYDSRSTNTPLAGGSTRDISIVSKSPKPIYTSGVNTNTVIINPTASGYYRAWQASTPQPNASNMNFTAGTTLAGPVIVATAPNKATVSTSSFISAGQADMVQDLYGYFAADYQANYTPPTGSSTANLTGVSSVSGNGSLSCAVMADTTVKCWGENYFGMLGVEADQLRTVPGVVPNLSNVKSVAVAGGHVCALIVDGTIKCWGYNSRGQLGGGTTAYSTANPTTVVNVSGAVSVAVAQSNISCAVISDGTVKCWGNNIDGQLGNGTASNQDYAPVTVPGLTGVKSVYLGNNFSCALVTGGTVKCWGKNNFGQLGNGTNTSSYSPTSVSGLTGVTALSGDWYNACTLITDGTVKCWGVDYTNLPSAVTGVTGARSLSAKCAVISGGTVKCWKRGNDYGQLGDGTSTYASSMPYVIPNLGGVTEVSVQYTSACAVISGGTLKCWGNNDYGQLGDGTSTADKTTPYAVPNINGATSIASANDHNCSVVGGGLVKCWGTNNQGQLGDGTFLDRSSPVTVKNLSGAITVSSGGNFNCAIINGGTVKCWGDNYYGQLGNGTTIDSSTPVAVTGLTGARAISLGRDYACALIGDGTVKCWGYNYDGQLGNGTTTSRSTPVTVIGITGATSVSASSGNVCALITGGTVKCWGDNYYGQLGNGTTIDSSTPVAVTGLTGAASVSAGYGNVCALITGGTVKCWGDNYNGELGNGTTTDSSVPVTVTGLSGVSSISVSIYGAYSVMADGTVKCWGICVSTNGTGNYDKTTTPIAQNITSVASIAPSQYSYYVCALIKDGTVKCWGNNTHGQMGDGSLLYVPRYAINP
jgi:alpha-tubulin suppressor-like RCC1 family protein